MEKINIYIVGRNKNTSAIVQFGSKKKGVGKDVVHSISKINVNESDDWCNWGDDNQYLKTLMEKVSKVGSAVGGLDVLISAHYGMGLKIYELMETDSDAVFKEKIPSAVPEIYDFFNRTQFELVMADIISDYETFGIAFPEFRLEGEILEDPHLKQRLIWSGLNYHDTGDQKEHEVNIFQEEFVNMNGTQGEWVKKIKVPAPGRYNIILTSIPKNQRGLWETGVVRITSNNIRAFANHTQFTFTNTSQRKDYTFDITEEEAEAGAEIVFNYNGVVGKNQYDNQGKNLGVMQIAITPVRQHTTEGTPIPYIFNRNRVNLKKSVPDITFGELVTIIKNLRNYDLHFDGNKAIMNTIKVVDSGDDLKDFRNFEVKNPLRMFNEKVSFNITFPDNESTETKNIYIDEKGYHINHKNIPSTTTEININMFCLPMTMFRGAWTAQAYEDSSLMLVYYDGLNEYGDNHAKNPPGLMDNDLANHLYPWFKNRLTNFVYKWSFITEKNKIRQYDIRSQIFCYGKRHLIKSWTKKSLSESIYAVEIETETY